jgi:hypothetical protein
VKGGTAYAATDEFGYQSVENKVHLHDLHSTVLSLIGLDHKRRTYPYSSRNSRLTDVPERGQRNHRLTQSARRKLRLGAKKYSPPRILTKP